MIVFSVDLSQKIREKVKKFMNFAVEILANLRKILRPYPIE
jgi:preprotein translocase subunit SecE